MPTRHPDSATLADFLSGDCSPGTAFLLRRHLQDCAQCRGLLAQMGASGAGSDQPTRGETVQLDVGVVAVRLQGVAGLGEAVYELQAEPGAALALPGALGIAELFVQRGALTLGDRCARAGDFVVLDGEQEARVTSGDLFFGLATAVSADE